MLFNSIFVENTILPCFFFLFIIDLYPLISTVIALIFSLIAEVVIPIGILSKEIKTEIEIHPVTAEKKNKKVFSII